MKKKLLIIDDDLVTRRLLAAILRKTGLEVIIATDGEEGLSRAVEILPDIILLDIVMPNLGGEQVCEHLKKHPLTRDIPIIFVTGQSGSEAQVSGLTLGAQDYICKPIHPNELIARVQAVLRVKEYQDTLKDLLRVQQELVWTREQLIEQYMNGLLGQLAESLIHEINNPLAVVIGFADMIKNKGVIKDEQLLQQIDTIHTMGIRASRKLTSLLCIAQKGDSQECIDINTVIEDVLAIVQSRLLVSEVQLFTDLALELPPIVLIPKQLSQAFLALLNNAIDVAESQSEVFSRKIWLTTAQTAPNRIQVIVGTSGQLLHQAALQQIFELQYLTPQHKVELGIYLAKSIIEAHNGSIDWQVIDNQSIFHISFPVP
jgi:CheY-like chemotaxis protein